MSAGYKSNFQQGLPWLGYNIFVQKFHSALKTSELHHSVWNLPHPQRGEAFVKANEKKKNIVRTLFVITFNIITKSGIVVHFVGYNGGFGLYLFNPIAVLDDW